jgi:hypothetical protein
MELYKGVIIRKAEDFTVYKVGDLSVVVQEGEYYCCMNRVEPPQDMLSAMSVVFHDQDIEMVKLNIDDQHRINEEYVTSLNQGEENGVS